MKDHIKEYKKKLEKGMCDYMQNPVSERSAGAVKEMAECWQELTEMKRTMCWNAEFTHEDAENWNSKMINADGTMGGHWTVEETAAVADSIGVKFDHISKWCWNVTMNMMYSDYSAVAEKFGVATAEFYAEMAKAFLFDEDGPTPNEKLSAYYHGIVCRDEEY